MILVSQADSKRCLHTLLSILQSYTIRGNFFSSDPSSIDMQQIKLSSLIFVFPSRMHYHDQVQAVLNIIFLYAMV